MKQQVIDLGHKIHLGGRAFKQRYGLSSMQISVGSVLLFLIVAIGTASMTQQSNVPQVQTVSKKHTVRTAQKTSSPQPVVTPTANPAPTTDATRNNRPPTASTAANTVAGGTTATTSSTATTSTPAIYGTPQRSGTVVYGTPHVSYSLAYSDNSAPQSAMCSYTVTITASAENTTGESTAGVNIYLGMSADNSQPAQTYSTSDVIPKGATRTYSHNFVFYRNLNSSFNVTANGNVTSNGSGLGNTVYVSRSSSTDPSQFTSSCYPS